MYIYCSSPYRGLSHHLGSPTQSGRNKCASVILEPLEHRSFLSAGALDNTFGNAGFVSTDLILPQPASVDVVLVQPDGSIIAAGQAGPTDALARYLPNGALDASFGTGGKVLSASLHPISDAALQEDGRIVALSAYSSSSSSNVGGLTLSRFNADGSLDTSFGTQGLVQTDLAFVPQGARVTIGLGGNITVATGSSNTALLMRFDETGGIDSSFGSDGQLSLDTQQPQQARDLQLLSDGSALLLTSSILFQVTSAGSLDSVFGVGGEAAIDSNLITPSALAIDSNNNIVIAGGFGGAFAFARFTSSGTLDLTFGNSGRLTTEFNSSRPDSAQDIIIQSDGRIVALGNSTGSLGGGNFAIAVYTSDWQLDPAFSNDGKLTWDMGDYNNRALAVALQPDGAIIAAGQRHSGAAQEFALLRVTAAGVPDPAFGAPAGQVTTPFRGSANDTAGNVAVQSDGKIIVVGQSDGTPLLARYNRDGSLDTSFGNGGLVLGLQDGEASGLLDVAIGLGGKIVVLGQESNGQYILFRFSPDGRQDSGFAHCGFIETGVFASSHPTAAIAVQNLGRIFVALSTSGSTYLARYNTNGKLDSTFGKSGKTTIKFAAVDDLAIQKDGGIVLGGQMKRNFFLSRLTAKGQLDSTFGTKGIVSTSFGQTAAVARVAIQPDGKILAAGSAGNLAIARYSAKGTLDKTFGSSGKLAISAGGAAEAIRGIALQPDGRIILAGVSTSSQTAGPASTLLNDAILVRLSARGRLDSTFGTLGIVRSELGSTPGDDDVVGAILQTGGRVVAVGSHSRDVALARFLT